jgi:sterol desaturase/sphingolipid hydroxylase (fatty acid hydroxylase superfamily)
MAVHEWWLVVLVVVLVVIILGSGVLLLFGFSSVMIGRGRTRPRQQGKRGFDWFSPLGLSFFCGSAFWTTVQYCTHICIATLLQTLPG